MSDNVLSQEEIDALLTAMDKGEVDLDYEETKEQEIKVEPYDLTSQTGVLRKQFYALEEVYDKFAGLLNNSLSTFLKKGIEIELVSSEMVKYGEFIQVFSAPTYFAIFGMDPLIGSSMTAVEPTLVYSLIDCMFGGDGKPIPEIGVKDFTLIEQSMMRKFSHEVLKNLERAWEIVYPIHIVFKKAEIKPEYVHLVTPDDLMIVVVLSTKGELFQGNIHLGVPYRMLEPIKDKLSSRYLREKDMEDAYSMQIQTLLSEIQVNIVPELGRNINSIKDIINLKIGDVLNLNTGPKDLLRINVETVPKYFGFPGIIKGNRAIQISDLIKND